MSMSIGSAFSFNFCSETNGSLPLPTVFDKSKKKPKSPSTKRRDMVRLAAFRNKKAVSPGAPEAVNSLVEFPRVIASQQEDTNQLTSFDCQSSDSDPKEVICGLSVPPTALSDPDILPSENNDKTDCLCFCLSTPCVCLLAAKPLSPVPSLKIKRTKDGWKSQLVSQRSWSVSKGWSNYESGR